MRLYTENIVKKYKKRVVVKGVSIEVSMGEIVGLLGPNGAGKTTTFYMMTGLIKPYSGKVFLDDEDITDMPMYKRAQKGVGYLAQEASVFRTLSFILITSERLHPVLDLNDGLLHRKSLSVDSDQRPCSCLVITRIVFGVLRDLLHHFDIFDVNDDLFIGDHTVKFYEHFIFPFPTVSRAFRSSDQSDGQPSTYTTGSY